MGEAVTDMENFQIDMQSPGSVCIKCKHLVRKEIERLPQPTCPCCNNIHPADTHAAHAPHDGFLTIISSKCDWTKTRRHRRPEHSTQTRRIRSHLRNGAHISSCLSNDNAHAPPKQQRIKLDNNIIQVRLDQDKEAPATRACHCDDPRNHT
jgi:hypothetical protein